MSLITSTLNRPPAPRAPAFTRALALAWLAATLTACDHPAPPPIAAGPSSNPPAATTSPAPIPIPPGPDADLMGVGRQVVGLAFSTLSSNLLGALARTTPAESLEFCSVNVAPILASLPVPPGTQVRRVSHKPRNPANRASREELALIESHAAALAAGRTNPPVLRPNPDGSVTFYAPILLGNPACLVCHGQPGTEIAPPTAASLARLYPDDQAHGFRLNQIRGLWAVTFPAR